MFSISIFYELHFPSGEVSGIQLKLVGSHPIVPVVSKKLENSAFFLGNAAPCFDTIANFL